jgi:hypothetical protein
VAEDVGVFPAIGNDAGTVTQVFAELLCARSFVQGIESLFELFLQLIFKDFVEV